MTVAFARECACRQLREGGGGGGLCVRVEVCVQLLGEASTCARGGVRARRSVCVCAAVLRVGQVCGEACACGRCAAAGNYMSTNVRAPFHTVRRCTARK